MADVAARGNNDPVGCSAQRIQAARCHRQQVRAILKHGASGENLHLDLAISREITGSDRRLPDFRVI